MAGGEIKCQFCLEKKPICGNPAIHLTKHLFHRARPGIERLVEASGYSFSSGHTMVSTVFYGFLSYLVWLNLGQSKEPIL
jgi:membrane-associated phospholipid phosphatase